MVGCCENGLVSVDAVRLGAEFRFPKVYPNAVERPCVCAPSLRGVTEPPATASSERRG